MFAQLDANVPVRGIDEGAQGGTDESHAIPSDHVAIETGLFDKAVNGSQGKQRPISAARRAFDILGYIPFVSTVSGTVRVALAALGMACVVVGGAVATAIGITALAVSIFSPGENGKNVIRALALIGASIVMIPCGLFVCLQSMIRGVVETVPFLGNGACLAWDVARCSVSASK